MEPTKAKTSSAKMLKALVRKALPATTRGRKRPREELEAPAASPATALVIEPVVRAPTRPRCSSAPSTAHPPARRQLLFGPTAPGIGKENIAPAALVSSLAQPEKTEVPPVASRTTLRTAPRPAKRARAKAFSFSQLQYAPDQVLHRGPCHLLTTLLAGFLAKTRKWSDNV